MKRLITAAAILAASTGAQATDLQPCNPLPLAQGGLFNISTRGYAGPLGLERLVAGFIIKEQETCVIIRARGQSVNLAPQYTMPNPKVHLRSLPDKKLLRQNNDWHKGPDVGVIAASGLHIDLGEFDAAIFACLNPGAYTATLISEDGEDGVAIIEVFDVKYTPLQTNEEPLGCKPQDVPVPDPVPPLGG